MGLSNNVKGLLHEIQFVEIENNDRDNVTAALFLDANHANTDILLTVNITGKITEIQRRAIDELANKMDLETSSQSNEELTTDVNDFIAKLVELDDNDSRWDYIRELPAISIFHTFNEHYEIFS